MPKNRPMFKIHICAKNKPTKKTVKTRERLIGS